MFLFWLRATTDITTTLPKTAAKLRLFLELCKYICFDNNLIEILQAVEV